MKYHELKKHGFCEMCGHGGQKGLLEPYCGCPDRLFHLDCLAKYLKASLDRPCFRCRERYTDQRIIRQSYTPSYFDFLTSSRMLPTKPMIDVVIVVSVLLILFRPKDSTGYGYPSLALMLLFFYVHQLLIKLKTFRNGFPHTVLRFLGSTQVKPYRLDVTAERTKLKNLVFLKHWKSWLSDVKAKRDREKSQVIKTWALEDF